jgi:hypothetical protein
MDVLPLNATLPLQSPVAEQDAPRDTLQFKVVDIPRLIADGLTDKAISIGAVPANGTTTGTPPVTMVRLPVRSPDCVGAKATDAAHPLLGGRDVPQLFVCEKSPDIAMLSSASGVVPAFVRVTGCVALVVPTTWPEKVSGPGATSSHGACNRYACAS